MKSYLFFRIGGSIHKFDIPCDDDSSIFQDIENAINSTLEIFRTPIYLAMNHMAYSLLCSAVSRIAGLDKISAVTEFRGLKVVVIPVPGHENNKYQPHIFGAFPEPGEHDLFRSLNQEQFHTPRESK